MGNGIKLQYRDCTLDRLGVMAQKAEKMYLKIINELLCNVQLLPKKSESSKYREKRFGYPDPCPVLVWKQFLYIWIWFRIHYLAGYPTGKPDSDHLWKEPVLVLIGVINVETLSGFLLPSFWMKLGQQADTPGYCNSRCLMWQITEKYFCLMCDKMCALQF